MSFLVNEKNIVDEAALIAAAKAQLVPEIERILSEKLADVDAMLRKLLADHTITITITPKCS